MEKLAGDNKPDKRRKTTKLSTPEEVFINQILQGKTQRAAFVKAYPSKKNWKPSSLDCEASRLFNKTKVQQRYQELLVAIRAEEVEKTQWTREQSIATLRFVIDTNKKELQRIEEAAEDELELLLEKIVSDPTNAEKYTREILKRRQMRRISGVHNGGIVTAVAELNKMQGYNEETINVNESVNFSGLNDLED